MGNPNSVPLTGVDTENLVGGEWKVSTRLGRGGFGDVYKVVNKHGHPAAVKVETSIMDSLIPNEVDVYRALHTLRPYPTGFAAMKYAGKHQGDEVLVIDRLGSSMQSALTNVKRPLSSLTVLTMGKQLLLRLEKLHSLGFVHCDLKPANVMNGHADPYRFYLIDFGLSERWWSVHANEHRPNLLLSRTRGTKEFMSLHMMCGRTPSRRDDLESLAYVLAYTRTGVLPWMGTADKRGMSFKETRRLKFEMKSLKELHWLPKVVNELFVYARGLKFAEKPEYGVWANNFQQAIKELTGN